MIVKNAQRDFIPMVQGVKRKTLAHGEKTLLIEVFLDKGSLVSEHAHPQGSEARGRFSCFLIFCGKIK